MTASAFYKFDSFVLALGDEVHDLAADTLQIALTDVSPDVTNTVIANITQISYTNLSSQVVTTTSFTQTSGVAKLICVDLTMTASGAVGPFRYAVLFNQSAANDELIGWYDYAAEITLSNGETFKIDFDGTEGVFQIA